MIKRVECPCRKCESRFSHCHKKCENPKYDEWTKYMDEVRAAKAEHARFTADYCDVTRRYKGKSKYKEMFKK